MGQEYAVHRSTRTLFLCLSRLPASLPQHPPPLCVTLPARTRSEYFGFEDTGNKAWDNYFIFIMKSPTPVNRVQALTSGHPVRTSPLTTASKR